MNQKILICVWCLIATWSLVRAEEQVETLEQLRNHYQRSSEIADQHQRPVLGSEGFQQKLKLWSEANKGKKEAGHALIPALLKHWAGLPDESPVASAVGNEIKTILQDLGGDPRTEHYTNEKSFLARTIWPLLARDNLTQSKATFLMELSKPQDRVRILDAMARRGQLTEALSWDAQAAYALALIRSGNDVEARNEIEILQIKVSRSYKANPEGGLDYGPEAGEGRYRTFVDYLQLCEILSGLRAAIANDQEGAAEHLKQARGVRNILSPEAGLLLDEIERRVAAEKK